MTAFPVEIVPIEDLRAHPRNYVVHPPDELEHIKASVQEHGIYKNIVIARDSTILAGHGLVEAARQLGLSQLPVIRLDIDPLDARALQVLTGDNEIMHLRQIDDRALANLFKEIRDSGGGLLGTGYDDASLALLEQLANMPSLPEPGAGGDEFDTTPEDGPTRTALGELWQIGPHRLLVGDCTVAANVARLMGGERAQTMVSDSPYGIGQEGIENDDPEGLRALFDGMLAAIPMDDGVVVNFQSTRLFPVWLDALRAAGQKFERMLWLYKAAQNTYPWRGWLLKSEAILASTKGTGQWNDHHPYAHDCYYVSEVSGEIPEGMGWHASVKPMSVVIDIVQRVSSVDDIVYDPFLGSGTTLIAAHRTGRRCYGMEIAPRYADVILRRAEAEGLECERVECATVGAGERD